LNGESEGNGWVLVDLKDFKSSVGCS